MRAPAAANIRRHKLLIPCHARKELATAAAAATKMALSRHDAKQAEQEATVVLRCFDGVKVPVPTALARRRSELVAAAAGERVVDVPGNVYGPVVARVAAYWEGRAAATGNAAGAAFDAAFLAGQRHDALVDLIHAAHHLGDAALFDLFRSRA